MTFLRISHQKFTQRQNFLTIAVSLLLSIDWNWRWFKIKYPFRDPFSVSYEISVLFCYIIWKRKYADISESEDDHLRSQPWGAFCVFNFRLKFLKVCFILQRSRFELTEYDCFKKLKCSYLDEVGGGIVQKSSRSFMKCPEKWNFSLFRPWSKWGPNNVKTAFSKLDNVERISTGTSEQENC